MPCCCVKILNLCRVPVCGELTVEQVAAGVSGSGETNEYKLVLDYFQTQITLTQAQTEGNNITFDVSMLNENFEFTGQIFDANGELVKITIGEDEFDCIKFKTVMNIAA
jgi:hypothetical protein